MSCVHQKKYTTNEGAGQLKYTVICAKLIGFLIAERNFEKGCEQWSELRSWFGQTRVTEPRICCASSQRKMMWFLSGKKVVRTSVIIVCDTVVLEKNIIPAPNNKITSQMFYSLAPSKGLNPRKFCSWDPRSGIFYWWNPESWALESRIQTKKSKIPLTTDTQFHLPRLESGTWNPECKVCNPEPRTVLDSHKWGK